MKQVTFEQSRTIQLNILIWFDRYCREHGLNYSLGEGTLIGAIRHKSFIPWDDDIDLLMPRKDYERFIKEYDGDEFDLIAVGRHPKWWSCYSRIADKNTFVVFKEHKFSWHHGLWISILPIDNFPDNIEEWKKQRRKIKKYKHLSMLKESYWTNHVSIVKNCIRGILRFVLLPFPYKLFGNLLTKTITQWNGEETKNKGSMSCIWHEPWVFDAEVVDEYIELPFEYGNKTYFFKSIARYDIYLRIQYGDYMQLPPEKDRFPKHGYDAYFKEE